MLEDAKDRSRRAAKALDLFLIRVEECKYTASCMSCLIGGIAHSNQKEVEPGFPVASGSNAVQEFVIRRTISFEIQAQIQNRFPKGTLSTKQKCDQESA